MSIRIYNNSDEKIISIGKILHLIDKETNNNTPPGCWNMQDFIQFFGIPDHKLESENLHHCGNV